jgi:hypothetical protein
MSGAGRIWEGGVRAWSGWLALAASLVLAGPAPAREACAFPAAPRMISESGNPHERGSRLLQVWEMDDAPIWWSLAEPAGYEAFRARAALEAGETDPLALLAQHPWANNRLVAERAAEWISPVNCLEMLLQQAQDRRIDMFEAPTEFAAIILRSPDGARLRIYAYTINEDGIGRMTPLTEPAMADHWSGWKVLAALHNHAFHPGQPALNGAVAPSTADARFNLNYAASSGMAQAWITNGLHTARIPAAAFGLFERDGP